MVVCKLKATFILDWNCSYLQILQYLNERTGSDFKGVGSSVHGPPHPAHHQQAQGLLMK